MNREDKALIAPEVAEMLQVDTGRVYELARRRQIPAFYLGRQVRFSQRAIEDWIAQGGTALDSEPLGVA